MTDVNRDVKSTITDIAGKNWADLCDSSQSSQLDSDSPLKNNEICAKDNEEDELYDLVFQPVKKEIVKGAPHDDLSLTSFMNNVHMVTPIKQENDQHPSNVIIDEDTISSPFIKKEETEDTPELKLKIKQVKNEIEKLQKDTKDILHAKRRLTSESESTVSDLKTPERVNKFNKKSTNHKNIHDTDQSPKIKLERETDPLIIARRQKQIDFGKNTIGYELYLENVPKHKRTKQHPKTPPKNLKFTRRAWDGLVKNWRVKLHCWDPDNKCNDDDTLTTGSSSNLCSLGSMTSLDSNSQASDSRSSTPPHINSSSEHSAQVKREKLEVSSPDPVKFKKNKTEY